MASLNLAVSGHKGLPKTHRPTFSMNSSMRIESTSCWSLSLGHILNSFSHCPWCVASVNTIANSPTAFVSWISHCFPLLLLIRSPPYLSENHFSCCQHSPFIRYSEPSPNKSLPGLSLAFTWLPRTSFQLPSMSPQMGYSVSVFNNTR